MVPYEDFNPEDLAILTYTTKPTGDFGPHRVPQGIKVIHIPTGTVVCCEEDRSQHRNRHKALEQLWLKVKGKPSYQELQEDLKFFLEQSVIIEHKQDHNRMRELRKKYGFDW